MEDILKELAAFKSEIRGRIADKWIVDQGVSKAASEEFDKLYFGFENKIKDSMSRKTEEETGRKVHPNALRNLGDLRSYGR